MGPPDGWRPQALPWAARQGASTGDLDRRFLKEDLVPNEELRERLQRYGLDVLAGRNVHARPPAPGAPPRPCASCPEPGHVPVLIVRARGQLSSVRSAGMCNASVARSGRRPRHRNVTYACTAFGVKVFGPRASARGMLCYSAGIFAMLARGELSRAGGRAGRPSHGRRLSAKEVNGGPARASGRPRRVPKRQRNACNTHKKAHEGAITHALRVHHQKADGTAAYG